MSKAKVKVNLIWDTEAQSIRGSFVNLMISMTILSLVAVGAFNDDVALRLEKLSALIIGFFTASMGIWSYKQIQENKGGAE